MTVTQPLAMKIVRQALLRDFYPEAGEELHRLARGGPDWPEVIRLASEHGVLPGLTRAVSAHLSAEAPPEVVQALGASRQQFAIRAMLLCQSLAGLSAALREAGLAHATFKGPAWATLYYGGFSRRSYADIDLLVLPPDYAAAEELLRRLSYEPVLSLDPGAKRRYLSLAGQLSFRGPGGGFLLDLHCRVASATYAMTPDHRTMLAHRAAAAIPGGEVACLGHEDNLLLACIHAAKHRWNELKMVCDVAHILAAPRGLDEDYLLGQARQAGALRALQLGCALAGRILRVPAPARLAAGHAPQVEALAEFLEAGMLGGRSVQDQGALADLAYFWRLQATPPQKLRTIFGLLFDPNPEDLANQVGSDAELLRARLKRPLRLLRKYGL